MTAAEGGFEFRGVAGNLTVIPFSPSDLPPGIADRLIRERYAWLTTVDGSGMPVPTLVWFRFDGSSLIVYSQPHSERVTQVFGHPQVSLHLESDRLGSGLVIVGGRAAVTAEGVDPRDDREYWAKYHVEAEVSGLSEAIASFTTRITITPTMIQTTSPT